MSNILIVDKDKIKVDNSIIELTAEKRKQKRTDESVWEYYVINTLYNINNVTEQHQILNLFIQSARRKNYDFIIINNI